MTLQCMYFGFSVRAFSSCHQTAEALILITLLIIFEPNRLTALFVCAVLVKLHTRDMYLTTLSRVFPFFVSLLVSRHFFSLYFSFTFVVFFVALYVRILYNQFVSYMRWFIRRFLPINVENYWCFSRYAPCIFKQIWNKYRHKLAFLLESPDSNRYDTIW